MHQLDDVLVGVGSAKKNVPRTSESILVKWVISVPKKRNKWHGHEAEVGKISPTSMVSHGDLFDAPCLGQKLGMVCDKRLVLRSPGQYPSQPLPESWV